LWGAEVAAQMILDLCGGEASALTVAGEMPDWHRGATLRPERLRTFGGADIARDEAESILKRLGFETGEEEGRIIASVPSWRPDIEGEHCLVEEVLRVHGYDRIAAVPLHRDTALPQPALTPAQRRVGLVRRQLAGRGLLEAVTFSFMPGTQAARFADVPDKLRLANPISADLDVMRPSILANLADAARRNGDRGFSDVALFEVGPAWHDDTPDGHETVAAGLRHGNRSLRHWETPVRPVDVFDAKADALAALAAAGAPVANLQVDRTALGYYHPGRSGVLRLGPTVLAQFGELHPAVLRDLDVDGPTVGFEVYVDRIPAPKAKAGRARPALDASALQPVTRDFAFLVDADRPADDVVRAAMGAERGMITDVSVFDVFEGAALGEGRKSVAVSVTLQPRDSTLTEAEIDAIAAKIVANVEKRTGATLRG
jgi:phenylalanyl-tRNA synthetase beta chain